MRVVVVSEPGKVEWVWSWMPTFLGQDPGLKRELEKTIGEEFIGKPLTNDTLDHMHERVLDIICNKHSSIRGLRDYLDAIKYVEGPG